MNGLYRNTKCTLCECVINVGYLKNLALALCILVRNLWANSLSLPLAYNTSFYRMCNRILRMRHHQRLSQDGCRVSRWIDWHMEVPKSNSTWSLGNLINSSLTMHDGGGWKLLPSLLTLPRWGGNGLLRKRSLSSRFHISGEMKFWPRRSGWENFSIWLVDNWPKKCNLFLCLRIVPNFIGRISTRQWRWMNGVGEFQQRFTRVVLIVARN